MKLQLSSKGTESASLDLIERESSHLRSAVHSRWVMQTTLFSTERQHR